METMDEQVVRLVTAKLTGTMLSRSGTLVQDFQLGDFITWQVGLGLVHSTLISHEGIFYKYEPIPTPEYGGKGNPAKWKYCSFYVNVSNL